MPWASKASRATFANEPLDQKYRLCYNTNINQHLGAVMQDAEYAKFVLKDSAVLLAQAVGIYAVALTAYWTLVG
jgi:hypothetical protein